MQVLFLNPKCLCWQDTDWWQNLYRMHREEIVKMLSLKDFEEVYDRVN